MQTISISSQATEKTRRPDPSGFVMSVSVGLLSLTVVAVFVMHFADRFGWQVL
jgi:hypothetical protein